MEKLVSVIIPVYNREKYIEECLISVLEQSYQNFEIILVDDGSTDNTISICNNIVAKDNRIKIFSGKHNGVSAARNLALDNAGGEYVFFMDSDDVIHPRVLETLLEKMEIVPISIIEGEDIKEDVWERYTSILKMRPLNSEKTTFYTNSKALERFFNSESTFGRMGGFMFCRSYIGNTRFKTDLHIGEDVYFIYENFLKGGDAAVVESEGYFWRSHKDKLSRDFTFEGFLSRLFCNELLWKSEVRFGRNHFVKKKKSNVLKTYIIIQKRNKLYSPDSKKMRKVMREYKKELFSSFNSIQKMLFLFSVYTPWFYFPVTKTRKRIEKAIKRVIKNQEKI